jgi:hypothetical protein
MERRRRASVDEGESDAKRGGEEVQQRLHCEEVANAIVEQRDEGEGEKRGRW